MSSYFKKRNLLLQIKEIRRTTLDTVEKRLAVCKRICYISQSNK
jgi:hypothetical protein